MGPSCGRSTIHPAVTSDSLPEFSLELRTLVLVVSSRAVFFGLFFFFLRRKLLSQINKTHKGEIILVEIILKAQPGVLLHTV